MKPREKLERFGIKSLTTSELISIILRHGTKSESIFDLSKRIIEETGPYSLKLPKTVDELSSLHKIGKIAAGQIISSIELGRRLFKKTEKQLNTLESLKNHLKDMEALKKEVFRGIYVTSSLEILTDEVISIGSLDKNIVHPREVFAPALEHSAYGVFLAHNHPSGAVNPSDEDIKMTIELKRAAEILQIKLIDHIIVSKKGIFSFHKNGLIN